MAGPHKCMGKKNTKTPLMRQKSDTPCVVYLNEDGMMGRRKKGPTSCRIYKLMIITIMISTCAICACVYAATSVIKDNVLSELIEYQEKLQRQSNSGTSSYGDLQSEISRVSKRSNNRGRRCRRHRHRRDPNCSSDNSAQQKSAVHMHVTPATHYIYEDSTASGSYFVWSEGNNSTFANFQYGRSPDVQRPHDIIGIKVRHSGMYEVYSQVVVRGLINGIIPYYCAQEIVVIRGGNRLKVLLKSFITQNEYELHGNRQPAVDTVFQFGVFHLRRQDEVRVTACRNVDYSNGDDREAFYFGVAQK